MASGDFSIGSKVWPGISKLLEEAGEVGQVCGKLIGSAGNQHHWDGTDLRERLHEEIADLRAALAFVENQNDLDIAAIDRRVAEKLALFNKWHNEQPPVEVCECCGVPFCTR